MSAAPRAPNLRGTVAAGPDPSEPARPRDLTRLNRAAWERLGVCANRFIAQLERGRGAQHDRGPEVPRVVAQAPGGGAVEQHLIQMMTEIPGDPVCGPSGIRRIRIGAVEDAHTRESRNH